jgi:hypothetical protein
MIVKDNTIFCGGTGKVSQESLDKINAFTEKALKKKILTAHNGQRSRE